MPDRPGPRLHAGPVHPLALVVVALFAAMLAGCGGTTASACGRALTEPLDPASLVHVLPGSPAPSYLSDPPTSGPHQPAPPLSGVSERAIDPPVQVGLLEAGKVLIQYRALAADEVADLAGLAGPKVVVAPNTGLAGTDRVVATAWLTKLSCRDVDSAALAQFASDHVDRGPG